MAALAAFAAVVPCIAQAQTGVVSGVVVSAGNGAPIAGAQVTVVGERARGITDDAGQFRIAGLSGSAVALDVRRLGFRAERVNARVGQTDLRIALTVNPLSLEGVVVTGTVGATERRAVGNAITTIDAAAVTAVAPVQSMQQLVDGRAPGVVIMPATGAVGTGSQVRVRGISSFSLGNNPLIYVDGVRVNNAAASGPANQAFGSSSISRLNDINPDEIESIEILKGPSAATLYGTEASNGVINIITKRGRAGSPQWTAIVRQGVNYLKDWRTRFPTNYGKEGGTGPIVAVSMDSLVAANGGDIFRNGRLQETQLAVRGGTDAVNYYASGNILDSQGAEPSNNTRKYSTRVSVGASPSPKLHLMGDLGYVTGPTYLSAEAGYGGRVWTTLLATPVNYNTFRHGYYSAIPHLYDQVYHMWQDLDRFTGSIRAEHQPLPWFTHRLTIGIDRTNEGNNYYQPRIDSLVPNPSFDTDALGFRELDQVTTVYRTFDYAATAEWNALPTVRLSTSAGAQYYRTGTNFLSAYGSVFPFEGLSSVNATTTGKGQAQDYSEDATLGYYGQEQVNWRDRLYATAAIRSDNSSAFGSNFNRVVYPKFSLSWVASEEPLWKQLPGLSSIQSFRLRAAYGEAGKAPGTYDALRTYSPVSGPGNTPAVTPNTIGNENLGPERGREYELGFDAGALDDRIGAEFTYYHKKTTDAILFRQLAPSIGFSGQQPFNAGSILNKGIELSLRATPVRTNDLEWNITANYATNDNKVLSLFPGTNFVTAGTYLRHVVGYPAFGWWERRVVSAQVDANGNAIPSSVMCDDGAGGTTPCYDASGTKVIAPVVYLGRSVPPHEGSLSTQLSFLRNFRVYTLVDFKRGQKKMDGNTRVRCTFFGGRCKENFFPTEADPVRVAEVQSNRQLVDFLITDASFAKWRELTFAYDIPARYAQHAGMRSASVAISGRNLHTWTDYTGFEPEAMFLGGSRGGNAAWEQTTLPQLTSWSISFNLGF